MHSTRDLEKKSSAVTLSDMEMFIFPELIYGLVLANMMSPRIWRWRDDPWFAGLERMKPYRRITRVKQYIMDHYIFNLDLDTWGLTTKERELARFRGFISEDILAGSNALFGYEGDKYYFDIDIRRHFGLDKYEGNIIPYWKTETVEAMDAFVYRPGYGVGAGECVSLATLYAAALFLVARIPLQDIYLMATPLHSQNFIDLDDGILTNNRRLVTHNMWFNGTALSAQARRALENERVTLVAHLSGYIHTVFDEASIAPSAYKRFSDCLTDYLSGTLTAELLGNFLRQHQGLQRCYQLRFMKHGIDHYIAMERLFEYEHGSAYRITDKTRDKLLDDVESEELMHDPLPDRIVFNEVEEFVTEHNLDIRKPDQAAALRQHFQHTCLDACKAMDALVRFCHVAPQLPKAEDKRFVPPAEALDIDPDMSREELIDCVRAARGGNPMADAAFYAYRDLNEVEPDPYLLAAVQRNPVSAQGARELDAAALVARMREMPDESIYDGAGRMAQPDEVWNYGRGDGAEKAVLMANALRLQHPDEEITIEVDPNRAVLTCGGDNYEFASDKQLAANTWAIPGASEI